MHKELHRALEPAFFELCRSSLDKHAGEQFYGVAIYTEPDYGYLVDSLSTMEGLKRVAENYRQDKRWRDEWATLDVAMQELKWSPCDSPYHVEFKELLDNANRLVDTIWEAVDQDSEEACVDARKAIHATCVAVLTRVRECRVFDDEQVVFNVLMGDQSDEERLLNAEETNPDSVVQRFRRELEIDDIQLEELKKNRWVF